MYKGTISTSIKNSFYTPNSLRRKNLWLVNLRWVSSMLLLIVAFLLHTLKLEDFPRTSLSLVAIVLAIFNLLVFLYLKKIIIYEGKGIFKNKVFQVVPVVDEFLLQFVDQKLLGFHQDYIIR